MWALTEGAKHAEDKALQKCKYLEGNSYSLKRGKWQAATLVNTQRMADQTCTQASMLAAFLLTTARDKRWWSHYHSLGSPDISTGFLARQLKKESVDLPYTPMVSIARG